MSSIREPSIHVLMLVGDTIGKRRRTGVQRVVVETARNLIDGAKFDLVRWDLVEGRLRFLDVDELNDLFGAGDWPEGLKPRPDARRVGRPFHEQLEDPASTWVLAAEVAWHENHGVDILSRVMAHCRAWGGRFAAVFYDLIPIRNAAYAEVAEPHEAYLAELTKADLIMPISHTVGEDLAELWRERGIAPHPPIAPVLLPDGGFGRSGPRAPSQASRKIALFGTIEPRKRQVQFLKAMESARRREPALQDWEVVVVGSLHGAVAAEFRAIEGRSDWLTYRDYISDAELDRLIGETAFTVFASDDEGYGLPIAESLAAGAPVLCANFGSMAEIAAGGGCLTVDVRDSDALEAAVIELCSGPGTLGRLRAEIDARAFQTWSGYARRLVELMAEAPPASSPGRVVVESAVGGAPWTDETFERLARADIARFDSRAAADGFIAEAAQRGWAALLPPALDREAAVTAAETLARERGRRRALAERERVFAKARRSIGPDQRTRPVFLRVLISTYNRADFVVANARWILNKVLGRQGAPVELMIVDGGSTDGTIERLSQIFDPRLKVVECPTNVGMLAGLREAARAPGAEYVWLVGDDDFIDPEAFAEITASLRTNAGLPFAFANFSVYHRAALGPSDTAARLILEGRPVADAVAPSGVMPVREIAAQTDNLFTAIYTIVWRADLLSAAYQHAFDGSPFENLTEAIPCTEYILREYADCDAYWHAAEAICGNAHNSWSHHRPRWHGVIMPLAFDLARQAGVDPERLQAWADAHLKLMEEALVIARSQDWATALGDRHADLARRVFRVLPPGFPSP
jgi:glycosyltransferase involved in cell wall biosynthesis